MSHPLKDRVYFQPIWWLLPTRERGRGGQIYLAAGKVRRFLGNRQRSRSWRCRTGGPHQARAFRWGLSLQMSHVQIQGAPKNALIEWRWSYGAQLNHQWLEVPTWNHLGLESVFLVVLYSWLDGILCAQVMPMVKLSSTALNFNYDFVLLVHFSGHPVLERNPFRVPLCQDPKNIISLD